jgi:1-deoxy-D-xylulose-5-phosphate reductoisomerase
VKRVVILGSTGSVGTSALEVVAALPERLRVAGLVAHTRWQLLAEQCRRFTPPVAVLTDATAFAAADRSAFPPETKLTCGPDAACELAQAAGVDVVLAAIVGVAGLAGTVAALEAGKTVALANKEALVVGGPRVLDLVRRRGGCILPVDSEHAAIHQVLGRHPLSEVERVVLTASGGPFRGRPARELASVTVAEALKHPTWRMGPKITIDSATMMNKALEVIEARWLFGLPAEKIGVVVHPESVVHSFVEFVDGSVLAQLSPPDMKLPIQYALTYPDRVPGPAAKIDWAQTCSWNFTPPDREAFPALDLGFEVARRGGSCGAVLNAANEAAVGRFLAGTIRFPEIARCCRAVLDTHDYDPNPTLDGLLALDRWARMEAQRWTPTRP